MKKRTISKLKSLFSSKKGKRQQEQQHSAKSSRSPSPDSGPASPAESETFHPIQRTPPPSRVGPPPSPPVPTTPVAPVAPEPPGPLSLLPCQVCGRTFVQQSLAKHVKICEKMTVKKRKTFDSSRQRREGVTAPDSRSGTDLEQYLPKNFGLPENSPFLEKSPPQVVKATPKPKVQSVRSAIMKPTADLQKCPHCSRAFGVRAFERHVEWCADKAKILPAAPAQPPPHLADAKQRLNARTQYKAPPVRGRRSSQSRDKSSLSRSASVESTRGVSPAPPREYGDYRHGRTRASESLSSNDCIDDSPHMPVIRNSRAPQNNSSGDANVKARQARLARDLSNSRRQEQTKASTIQSSTVPGPSKLDKNLKVRLDTKRRQQLQKLDEIANKYKERENKREHMRENDKSNSKNKNKVNTKSQIPLDKNPEVTERKSFSDNIRNKSNIRGATNIKRIGDSKCDKKDMDKESTMSLDSLDENIVNKNSPKYVKEDMLCPCVPCVIHENNEPILNVAKKRIDTVEESKKEPKDSNVSPKIRVLFKNKKFHSDKHKKENMKSKTTVEINQNLINTENGLDLRNFKENQRVKGKLKLDPQVNLVAQTDAVAKQNIKDLNKEHTGLEINDQENINYLDSRHGSGETYTKFTENPADLDEFFTITDQMINKQQHDELNNNIAIIEKDIDELHTPQTDSLETLNTDFVPYEDVTIKSQFSNALDKLKKNFKDLMLEINKDSLPPICKEPNYKNRPQGAKCEKENIRIENINMEHITVYEFKHKQTLPEKSAIKENSQIKLPYITDTKNNTKYSLNKKKVNKGNRKNKMLSLQKRASKNYQTFIINNEDTNESNDDAPPLKLPRIENRRLDDNYDPFASAARQMKELMSSDKSVPKKPNTISRGNTNTLPNLKQAKDKLSLSHPRPDNTKMMKDTINKTYQKTPTLQRMKSFGSSNIDNNSSFGGRCSSFRVNRNEKKPAQNLNSTFTKSSKENIASDKTYFNRNSSMNRSFSSYSSSSYSTPKLKDKIPKLSQSVHHGFQRNTIKQPLKLDKINKNEEKSDPVTLGSIFSYDNGSSMTDSNYIDPRLINENDNLPINVNTILNNPDIISSMESLLTTENLPAKFESFNSARNHDNSMSQSSTNTDEKNNNINNIISPTISDLSSRYDKIISSLEQSVTSKTSARDDDSLCEDFDLEEFMTSFDEEIHKQKNESKRTYSSTTRIVAHSEICDEGRKTDTKVVNSPKIVNGSNGMIPVNKSTSLVFSSNNIAGEKFFPSSVKRSTSLLDSIQKKTTKTETSKSRQSVDKLEDDIMQSLKDFDKFYESQKNDNGQMNKEMSSSNKNLYHDTIKRDVRKKNETKAKTNKASNGNCTPNGKASNDSAYSSLNRISPSKLSLCKENGVASLDRIPAGSDTSSGHKDDLQSISSDEFLAMERTAELTVTEQSDVFKDVDKTDKNSKSRESARASPTWRRKEALSSSGSETSLYRTTKESSPAPRLSRFCHECGSKFPVDTAKFCIECGVKRLIV